MYQKYRRKRVLIRKGKVKKFLTDKGYGFIQSEEEQGDIFFHYTEIVGEGYRTVCEGQPVEFSLNENDRGKYAKGIVKL